MLIPYVPIPIMLDGLDPRVDTTENVFGKKSEPFKGRLTKGKGGSVFTDPKKENVELSKLKPGQEHVVKSKIDYLAKNWDDSKADRIEVLRRGNDHHLMKGHHRAAAAIRLGKTHLPANVYDVEG